MSHIAEMRLGPIISDEDRRRALQQLADKVNELVREVDRFTQVTLVSENYSVEEQDYFLAVSAASGRVTLVPPPCRLAHSRMLEFKKTDNSANAVRFQPVSPDTVDGAAFIEISTQYQARRVICDGHSNWMVD